MPRRSLEETMAAAVQEYDAGVKVPVICQKYRISDRTLYRWRRAHARARAESGLGIRAPSGAPAVDLAERALRVVAAMLSPEQRSRAVLALEADLRMTRAEARRLLGVGEHLGGAGARVGMALSRANVAAPLCEEFGNAAWLAVHVPPDRFELLRNVGRSGVTAASTLRDAGCEDVIALHLGPRAHERLVASGLRVWRGLVGVPARDLVSALGRGELEPWPTGLVTLNPRPASESSRPSVAGEAR